MKVKAMTSSINNPWVKMYLSSTRRIDFKTSFNFFWVNNDLGKYGFLIKFDHPVINNEFVDKIKGLTIIKRIKETHVTDLFLLLNNNDDWQIFLSLCNDLFDISSRCQNESELIIVLNNRLKRWQKFLSQDNRTLMTEKRQMGLLTELLCLKDYIYPYFQINQAVISWVGPDFDKQDFSIEDTLIEVKSFVSSKGAIIRISSLHQLANNIKPLFLFSFGISRDENGFSIEDLISSISVLFNNTNNDSKEIFESKLAEYGYIEGITTPPFYKFRIDIVRAYSVSHNFPKILPCDVQSQITSAEYSIDLSKCGEFEVEIKSVFKPNKQND
jgi:hypothetical protein